MNRVWTFVISKTLSRSQLDEFIAAGQAFVAGWTAHDMQLSATFAIYRDRIAIVQVNESVHNASGCSIDKLTRFMKDASEKFGIDLMNRMLVAFENRNGEIQVEHAQEVRTLLAEGKIDGETEVYNTAVATEEELHSWKQPLKNTWLSKYIEHAKN